jgi:pimeloyl-ACP methyl ester carboxylesterase
VRDHRIAGGNGAELYVRERGNEDGPAILFIHGFSQCGLTWRRQMQSPLADEFRLVALDLRGHGHSEKPPDGYADGRLWAEDVHQVIAGLGLERAVLVGWSYGGFVICDYLRYFGDHDIVAINLVGAATRISQETAGDVLGSEFLALLPGFFSPEVGECVQTLKSFVAMCASSVPSEEEFFLLLGYNASVPPSVRQALLSRTLDNGDVLANLRVPVLIAQGKRDRIVQPRVAHELAAMIPGASLSMYEAAGHAPFIDDTERFNRELATLVRTAAQTVRV